MRDDSALSSPPELIQPPHSVAKEQAQECFTTLIGGTCGDDRPHGRIAAQTNVGWPSARNDGEDLADRVNVRTPIACAAEG